MFRVSFVVLAIASALAFTGCSKCSSNNETAPATEATAPAAPAETAPAADAAAPAAPAETAPAADAAAPAATPAEAAH